MAVIKFLLSLLFSTLFIGLLFAVFDATKQAAPSEVAGTTVALDQGTSVFRPFLSTNYVGWIALVLFAAIVITIIVRLNRQPQTL